MEFHVAYDNGYIVQVKQIDAHGCLRYFPLRKFHDQGDAFIYRDEDCKHLTDAHIRVLIRQYNPNKRYKRINARKFVDWDKWAENLYQQELALT